mmetsp:Transcript_55039/g.75227  ORF Transcript_55039/g.75227 Transcript_55039/m.75227 type:complete len:82 (-) Transcript_55039:411-656(-)
MPIRLGFTGSYSASFGLPQLLVAEIRVNGHATFNSASIPDLLHPPNWALGSEVEVFYLPSHLLVSQKGHVFCLRLHLLFLC